ncbi:MAG: methionyl-tRNA formyltransferase, partial [Gammaproteobacteria bacterium]|nr:methionyl-tRNA formyltransferase [Gammaproteobacteria bacterium]NIR85997.1 methionyl-tRNA formyltransferase [Gammaproteobacteria bacterium]NIV53443.1 methionyl-tRNA formyltransferase [Gammaproteobacteria bacterium]
MLQPERVSDPEPVEQLKACEADVFIVAAYGQILRQRVLDIPKRGILNVHASLLPRWRGASPVAAAILAGDEVTGVSLMEMVRALDAGPVVSRVEEPISPHDTTGTLEPRLA